jgi:membrane dipeptidase
MRSTTSICSRAISGYPKAFELARTAADVERVFAAGRIASLMGVEGGSMMAS